MNRVGFNLKLSFVQQVNYKTDRPQHVQEKKINGWRIDENRLIYTDTTHVNPTSSALPKASR